MLNKEEFEKRLMEQDGSNQTYWLLQEVGFPITNGVKFVIDELDAWFIIVFIVKAALTKKVLEMRLKHGYKTLIIMNVTDDGCLLTLHIADKEVMRMEVNDRPDLPKVRVPMIMGREVVYLLNED